MRFVLIAHGLIDRTGHHYMEARAFKEEADRHGLSCTILANRNVSPSIRDELDAHPLFQYTPYKQFFRRWYFGKFWDFRLYGRAMSRALMSLPPGMITSSDVLVFTLTKARDIRGLALWLARIPREKHPFVAINFMVDDISRSGSETSDWSYDFQAAFLYRSAFSHLRKKLGANRFLLSAGGTRFAQNMARVLDHPVLTFPLPVQHEITSCQTEKSPPDESPLIVFLGHTHKRKGPELIGSVISKVLEQYPCCRFLLQANPICWEKRWEEEIGVIGMERVCIHRGEMSQEEYQSAMSRADLVLLPYLSSWYTLQTSGIFSEAMALGKVSVVPDGTWMADKARKHGGGAVIFHKFEGNAIAEAVCKALQGLPGLTRDMKNISSAWQENMGMKAFFRRILDEAMVRQPGE